MVYLLKSIDMVIQMSFAQGNVGLCFSTSVSFTMFTKDGSVLEIIISTVFSVKYIISCTVLCTCSVLFPIPARENGRGTLALPA